MKRLGVGRRFAVPCDVLWDMITDTAKWPRWGPSVRAVSCPDRWIGQGSRGAVLTAVGLWLPFVVSRCDPLRYWEWRVAGIPATGHRLTASGPHGCRLDFELPLLWLPYALVCRRALENIAGLLDSRLPGQDPTGLALLR